LLINFFKRIMNIQELTRIVNGTLITQPGDLRREVRGAFAADLMSDVLASIQPEAVLITGLCNPQVVRTAHMADVAAVVLVRGKHAPAETIDLANLEGIPIISTPHGMYEVCARVNQAGLSSLEQPLTSHDCECQEE
jgi:predicted transcriptional regulator